MTTSLSGRVALVTGGGFGIGRAIVSALADAGANVFLTDLSPDLLAQTVAEIPNTDGIAGDLSDPSFPKILVDAAVARFGGLDILVNNAADQRGTTLEDTPDELFARLHAVNVDAPWRLCRLSLPHLKKRPGCVLNLSSLVASMPLPDRVAYSITKSSVAGLTRALAADLGRVGIRVNALAPGHIMSVGEEKWNEMYSDREKAVMHSAYPLGRCGHVDEVASAALFLVSDASSFITGVTLAVDGGMAIQCPETTAHRAARDQG